MSKFNKGDRIAVYVTDRRARAERRLGEVIRITSDGLVLYRPDHYEPALGCLYAHPKQVRKLGPKGKQREFWISIHHDASIRLHSDREQASRCFLEGKLPSEVFHVREVRK